MQVQPTETSTMEIPGTNLQLVEDDFGDEVALSQEEEHQDPNPDPPDMNAVTERRYPLCLNCQKPECYHDGSLDN